MQTPRVAMPPYRIDRADRTAAELEVGDFVHDELVPFVVAGFKPSAAHVVAVVGRLNSGTDMGVRYLSTHPLDVSRVVPLSPPAPVLRRRHLSLCPPIGGAE